MTVIAFQIHNSPPLGYILAIQRRVAVTYTRMNSEAEEQHNVLLQMVRKKWHAKIPPFKHCLFIIK